MRVIPHFKFADRAESSRHTEFSIIGHNIIQAQCALLRSYVRCCLHEVSPFFPSVESVPKYRETSTYKSKSVRYCNIYICKVRVLSCSPFVCVVLEVEARAKNACKPYKLYT